jgi:AcrR family transcriptional regulator
MDASYNESMSGGSGAAPTRWSGRRAVSGDGEPPGFGLRAQRTLARLLEAGVKVFERDGYYAARVDDIVRAARTSHGTFYVYFANKEELFATLTQNIADQMAELAESLGPVTPERRGYEELRRWIGSFADLYSRYGSVIQVWTEAETGSSDIGRRGSQVLADFSAALSRRIAPNLPSDVNPDVTALALVAMIERANYYALSRDLGVSRDLLLDALAVVAWVALFNTPLGVP